MLEAGLSDRILTFCLAETIDAERRDRIVLRIRLLLLAVEHIVGRQVDQGHAQAGAGPRNDARPFSIDGHRRVGFRLGLVDEIVGGRVYYQRWHGGSHTRSTANLICDVDILLGKALDLYSAARGDRGELRGQLPALAKDQNQVTTPSLWPL